jgi:antitoxin HicB
MKTEAIRDVSYYMALPYTIVLRRDSDGDVVARIEELAGCTAHGKSEAEAIDNLRDVQAVWLEDCIESEEPVPVPEVHEERLPSGKWVQRVPRTLHRKLAKLAKQEEVSLNQMVTSILAEAVGIRTLDASVAANYIPWWPSNDPWESSLWGEWRIEHHALDARTDLIRSLHNAKRIMPRATGVKLLSDAYTKEIEDYAHPHK